PLVVRSARAHRALRSFPTRRSSDLDVPAVAIGVGGRVGECQLAELACNADLRRPGADRLPDDRVAGVVLFRAISQDFAQSAGFVDRKSTRLNSSHVKISYAVFCLKK